MEIIVAPTIAEANGSMVLKDPTVAGVWRPKTRLMRAAEHMTSAVD
jgi:hypothetical protein